MAHKAQIDFFNRVKEKFPNYFNNVSVLDIGSMDLNGNNRFLFKNYSYIGVDLMIGNNVDVVSKGHEYNPNVLFDVVISSECFEHDMYYKETILNCVRLTKPKGLFTFSCASTGRLEHGTSRCHAWASPISHVIFNEHYKNLTETDIREFLNCDEMFSEYYFEYNPNGPSPNEGDLYFWGIKK